MNKFLRRLLPLYFCLPLLALSDSATTTKPALTDGACEKLGRELVGFVNSGEPAKMADTLDLHAFVQRSFKGLDVPANTASEFGDGFIGSFKTSLRVWKNARFVRVFTQDGEKRILMRVISEEGAFNYFEWVCAPKVGGGAKAVDLLTYLNGELVSQTARRTILPILAESQKGFFERLTKGEGAYVKSVPKMEKAVNLVHAGKSAEALAILEQLPAEVKTSSAGLMVRLQAAQGTGNDDAYLRVITDWETARPDDPALVVVSIDGHLMRKDFARCLQSLDAVQKRVGGDGYLQALKANVHNMAGEPAKARTAIREAVALEPDLTTSYDIWFGFELQEKNWGGLVEALTVFQKNFPSADIWGYIKGEETWAPFRESAECKSWLEKRASK